MTDRDVVFTKISVRTVLNLVALKVNMACVALVKGSCQSVGALSSAANLNFGAIA